MASTQDFYDIILKSEDVPGAYINPDELENSGNLQLKRWLECRGLKQSGIRCDLLSRCKDAIAGGKLDVIDVGVDKGKWYTIKEEKLKGAKAAKSTLPSMPPLLGWKSFPSHQIPVNFNYGHIYHYLLESVQLIDERGNKSGDTDLSHMTSKPLTKGEQYVKSNSVGSIRDHFRNGNYFLKAKVEASMRKESRDVHVTISSFSGAILDASCTCPGSALGRCNHVAALLLFLNKHVKENGYDPTSCTGKQCSWSEGSKVKTPGKVADVQYPSYKAKKAKLSDHDPRPEASRVITRAQKNQFMTDMKYSSASTDVSMWETLLCYKHEDYKLEGQRKGLLVTMAHSFFESLKDKDRNIYMIPGSEDQAESFTWRARRWFRITASTAKQANTLGSFVNDGPPYSEATHRRMYNFVSSNVWQLKSFSTIHTQFGIESEDQARVDYESVMQVNNPGFKASKTGLWINNSWPELGCSPDGLVHDPAENDNEGLVEIKCLKLFRTVAQSELFGHLEQNKVTSKELYNACFARPTSGNATLELKTTHAYYFQIQFQLAVTGLKWCDFVLWSSIGKPNIERVRRDDQLINGMITNVTSLWHHVIAPEIFEMRVPRKLFPFILYEAPNN